jgi:hypothetical protein
MILFFFSMGCCLSLEQKEIEDYDIKLAAFGKRQWLKKREELSLVLEETPGLYERVFMKTVVAPCCAHLQLKISSVPETNLPLRGNISITVDQKLGYCGNCQRDCRTYVGGSILNRELADRRWRAPSKIRHRLFKEDLRRILIRFDLAYTEHDNCACHIFLTVRGRINDQRLNHKTLCIRLNREHC